MSKVKNEMSLNEVFETLKRMDLPNTMVVNDLMGDLEDMVKQTKPTTFEERMVFNYLRLLEEYLSVEIISYED
jgi:hypothetical protein